MTEGRYEIESVLRGHSTYRRVKEDVMKEVAFEQGFISRAGFSETNIRGRRKGDGTFSSRDFPGSWNGLSKKVEAGIVKCESQKEAWQSNCLNPHSTGEDTEITKIGICPAFSIGRTKIEPKCLSSKSKALSRAVPWTLNIVGWA